MDTSDQSPPAPDDQVEDPTVANDAVKMAHAAQEFTSAMLRLINAKYMLPQGSDDRAMCGVVAQAIGRRCVDIMWPKLITSMDGAPSDATLH